MAPSIHKLSLTLVLITLVLGFWIFFFYESQDTEFIADVSSVTVIFDSINETSDNINFQESSFEVLDNTTFEVSALEGEDRIFVHSSSSSKGGSKSVENRILTIPDEIDVIVSYLEPGEEDEGDFKGYISSVSTKTIRASSINALLNDSSIRHIEEVKKVTFLGNISNLTFFPEPKNISSEISVCIPDTGIDPSLIPVMDSFISKNISSVISHMHGTQVAKEIIASAPDVSFSFLDAKIANQNIGNSKNLIDGVFWCIKKNPDIIVFALAIDGYSSILHNIVKDAYNDGILFVAAGKKENGKLLAPAIFQEVISVGSITDQNKLSSFSPRNVSVEFVDYGEGANVGTSFSSAKVVGDLSQILVTTNLTPEESRYNLRCNAIDLGDFGFDTDFGYGLSVYNISNSNITCNDTVGMPYVANVENSNGFSVLTALDGAQTIVLRFPTCNRLFEDRENYVYIDSSINIMDCGHDTRCDKSEETKATMQFILPFNSQDVQILNTDISIALRGSSNSYADGEIDIYAYMQSYNPNQMTENNYDSSLDNRIASSPNEIDEGEVVSFNFANYSDTLLAFNGNQVNFMVKYDADGDDYAQGDLRCSNENTYLTVTYRECNPNDPCCTENYRYKEAGAVCKEAHDFSCSFANINGCGGVAYEDRCTGTSSVCPNNNFEISYPGACSGTVCQQSFCSAGTFQPQGVCSANTCVVGTATTCPLGTNCDSTDSFCTATCSIDSDCGTGMQCVEGVCAQNGEISFLEYNADQNIITNDKGSFTYDGFGMIDSFTSDSVTEYVYDETGSRIYVESDGQGEYYIDNAIYSDSGPPKFYYAITGQKLALKENGQVTYFQNDMFGSLRVSTKEDNSFKTYTYSTFGLPQTLSSAQYMYTGHEYDSESALNYMGARYQDGALGFMYQRDAIYPEMYDPQQLNLYSYGRNNPYAYTDPSGNYISPLDIVDYISVIHGAYSLVTDPSWENAGWLAADVVGAAIPGLGGFSAGGKAIKAAASASKAVDKGVSAVDGAFDLGVNSNSVFKKTGFRGGKGFVYEDQVLDAVNNQKVFTDDYVNVGSAQIKQKIGVQTDFDLYGKSSGNIGEVKYNWLAYDPRSHSGRKVLQNLKEKYPKMKAYQSEVGKPGAKTFVMGDNIDTNMAQEIKKIGYDHVFEVR